MELKNKLKHFVTNGMKLKMNKKHARLVDLNQLARTDFPELADFDLQSYVNAHDDFAFQVMVNLLNSANKKRENIYVESFDHKALPVKFYSADKATLDNVYQTVFEKSRAEYFGKNQEHQNDDGITM